MPGPGTRKKLVIVGARIDGHAGVVLDLVRTLGTYDVVGFVDNTPDLEGRSVEGIPVIGSTDDLEWLELPAERAHIAIGDNVARGGFFRMLRSRGIEVETLIHPTAIVSPRARIGRGCYVGPGSIVNTGAEVADACLINSGVILEHDGRVGFGAHLGPGSRTGGRVTIGEYSFLGLGSTAIPDVEIGSGVMIGAGSAVVKDVPSNTTVLGYAARPKKTNIYAQTTPDVDTLAPEKIYVARPTLPDCSVLEERFNEIHDCGMVSNFARFSKSLESDLENRLSVNRALTFPNATSALMLALRVLELDGEVILPSFTFSATGHALLWNNLTPVFADIDPQTLTLDPEDVERKITSRTSAILGVHTFGNPCYNVRLEGIAARHGLRLIFDAAHALGSRCRDRMIGGFGDLEIFSLSGTKVVTSGEGGIVTSNDESLMQAIDRGRNYGSGSDYNCTLLGLNGKMSEYHAAIALENLQRLAEFVTERNRIARAYIQQLSGIPGLSFQHLPYGHDSTYKDFAMIVDPRAFGTEREGLIAELNSDGIYPKRYFYPPLHRMDLYRDTDHRAEGLEATERIAGRIVCLPIYSHMDVSSVDRICDSIRRIRRDARQPAAHGGAGARVAAATS